MVRGTQCASSAIAGRDHELALAQPSVCRCRHGLQCDPHSSVIRRRAGESHRRSLAYNCRSVPVRLRRMNCAWTRRVCAALPLLSGCAAGLGQSASVAIAPSSMPRVGSVDERFQSYNIEMVEVTGGPIPGSPTPPSPIPPPPANTCVGRWRSPAASVPPALRISRAHRFEQCKAAQAGCCAGASLSARQRDLENSTIFSGLR